MKSEYITRTFTTAKVVVSAPGKQPVEVDTIDSAAVIAMYAQMHGLDVDKVKVETKEESTLYRMSVEAFLKHAEIAPKREAKKEDK